MQIGDHKERITIQQKSVSRDEYGGEIIVWVDVSTHWAKVIPLRLKQYIAARAAMIDATLEVHLRYVSGVNAAMRILWKGDPYPIISVIDMRAATKELEILCSGPAVST